MSGVNEVGATVVNAVAPRQEVKAERDDSAELRQAQSKVAQELAQEAARTAQQNNPKAVTEAVNAINAQVQRVSQNLKFSIDQESGRTVVKVVEGESGKVIRQIPSEEALAISEALEKMQGLIIEQKA